MNCSEWEREIAGESQSVALEEHLKVCANCRAFAREIEDNRAALQSLGVDGAAFDAVRGRVLGEIQTRRRRTAAWAWSAAAAACVAILCASFVVPRFQNPPPPRPPEFAKAPKLVEWTVQPARQTVRVSHRHAPAVANVEPLVIKMLTNDPDVIVVWLIDPKGDSL
jgi:predicted anti-sigma-YlaC factor YlaD